MPNGPFVSVVVPVLDRAAMIGDLLDSLVAQDHAADQHEIIVVDNGSTDGTQRVVERHPVRLLSETRRSSYAARNRGIEASRGEVLAFIDSDCIAAPDWLRRLVEGSDQAEYGAFAGEVMPFRSETRMERYFSRRRAGQTAGTLAHPYLPYATTSNVAYRRAVLEQVGRFDATLRSGGDVDLGWRMQEQTGRRFAYRPAAVVWHRNRATIAAMYRQSYVYGEGIADLERRHPAFHRAFTARAGSPAWRNVPFELQHMLRAQRASWARNRRDVDTLLFLLYDALRKIAFNRGVRRGRRRASS
jgi:glycosyltransferase involved in cell wall biosynthesis